MLKKIIAVSLLNICNYYAFAQNTWTLDRCIDYAQKNSISVRQVQIQMASAELTDQQLRASKRPDLNGSLSGGLNFGRNINRITNQFVETQVGFNSIGLNTGGPIYQAGRTNKSLAQNQFTKEATQADLEYAAQTIALNVANSYLRILLAEEQVTAAQKRFEQSKRQSEQVSKFIVAGARPKNDIFEFAAQLSRSEQSLVQTQNTVDLEYLTLKQLLELDPETAFKIDKPNIKIPTENGVEGLTMKSIYQQSYNQQSQIKAGEMRLKAAEMQADIERTSYLPTINWFAGISTNYSHVKPDKTSQFPIKNDKYSKQINSNLGQNIGVNLNIPIYDRGFTKIAIERARLSVMSQQLQNQRTTQQLKSDIQNAMASAKAGKKQWEATEKTFEAAKAAFDNADKKFNVGAANAFELTTAKNNMDTAERDVIIAKYDYIFRLKIIDFYQGKKITLN